jgi:hypothetical protein
MHIGLIGGIGPAATEFYYRGLTDRHAKSGTRLDLTIANAEVRDLSQNLANEDAGRQAGIFAALIARLKAAGAHVAAVTSMGGHFCIGELLPISPLPILNGIPEVDAAVKRGKFKTIGIIGTRMVMETRLYGAVSSATVVVTLGAGSRARRSCCSAAPTSSSRSRGAMPASPCSIAPMCTWRRSTRRRCGRREVRRATPRSCDRSRPAGTLRWRI